jgi:hypothetical protein
VVVFIGYIARGGEWEEKRGGKGRYGRVGNGGFNLWKIVNIALKLLLIRFDIDIYIFMLAN